MVIEKNVFQGMCSSAWSAVSMLSGGGLTLHAVLAAPEYKYTPKYMADLLYSAAVSIIICL